VSSQKDSERTGKPKSGYSRRGFLGGAGIATGALGTGLLVQEAEAAPPPAKVAGPGPVAITLSINGQSKSLTVEPRVTLCDALRNHLDMTVLAIDAQGKSIETIEGIGSPENLDPVSAAFWNNDAQQCGYCTPGFVMACKSFLGENPNPTLDDLKHGLGGNLCRCGTYSGLKPAALEAAKNSKGTGGRSNG